MKKAQIGTWVTLGHPSIAEIMAEAGFDRVCIDMEHSVIDYAEAQLLISAIQSKGKPAYVRVGENNPRIIKRVLDAGADGIIVPFVCSVEDARNAVKSIKYPPEGNRGVGLARAQGYGFSFNSYKKKEIKLIAIIEHFEAIKNLEEIIQVNGIDGTFIGPYDLSGSLGKPGEYEEKAVKDLIEKYEKIASKHNKLMGFHVVPADHKMVQEKIEKGYNFIAFSLDTVFLGEKCRHELKSIRT